MEKFNDSHFSNFTYTVQWYNVSVDSYFGVDGMVEIPITTETVTVTGLIADVQYQVIFTFDDGNKDFIIIEYETPE